jgi:hypothetical protein
MGDVIIDGLTGANRLVVLDANGKIPALDGSAVTAIAGANFSTGTIPVARLDTGTTAGKVVKLDGNAKLPAVSGAALTGIVGATQSSSDPTISTNPSGGVGTEWQNTTSGEVYVCTDATAGANVWTNVGGHSGDVAPWAFQGTSYGWVVGGYPPSNQIRKYSFASDGNSVDAGDILLTPSAHGYSGHASTTQVKGYLMGNSAGVDSTLIEKWDFASNGNSADVGDLLTACAFSGGHANGTYIWNVGGEVSGGTIDAIEKFAVATDGNTVDQGNLTRQAAYAGCGNSSTHGYTSQGSAGPQTNIIDKHAFANDNNATDVGDCLEAQNGGQGNSSTTYGYTHGGSPNNNRISKYPFASDANATDVGNMTLSRGYRAPASSTTYGYGAGGWAPGTDIIEKYSFASDADATDVGDLSGSTSMAGGTQSSV